MDSPPTPATPTTTYVNLMMRCFTKLPRTSALSNSCDCLRRAGFSAVFRRPNEDGQAEPAHRFFFVPLRAGSACPLSKTINRNPRNQWLIRTSCFGGSDIKFACVGESFYIGSACISIPKSFAFFHNVVRSIFKRRAARIT